MPSTRSPRHALGLPPRAQLALVTLLLAVLAGCGHPGPVSADVHMSPEIPHIQVDGIATLEVAPDVVDLSVTLAIKAERPSEAVAQLNQRRQGLESSLRAAGVKDDELRLGHVDVGPVYQPHPQSHLIDGYRAAITLIASTTEFTRIAALMEAAATSGATRMSTSFRSTRMVEMKKKVRDMALRAAREKAKHVAAEMGVELGELISVQESGSGGGMFRALSNENAFAPAARGDAPLQPDAIPLSLTVEVRYGLLRAPQQPAASATTGSEMYEGR